MATFFFDNDISFRIVRALRNLVNEETHQLIALRERFPVDTADVDWIPQVGRDEWIVISRDHNQRRRSVEHSALKQNQVIALYIRQSGKSAELFTDAARLIQCWPKIEAWGASAQPGTLARLASNDKIHIL